jgi:hypothetical protein
VEPRRRQGVWEVSLSGQGPAGASSRRAGTLGPCTGQGPTDLRQQALLRSGTSGGGIVMCPFCGHRLSGTQTKSCTKRLCLLAAKRARAHARRQTDPSKRREPKGKDDGRTLEFPPELEYLDQDPGITPEQMLTAKTDPALRRLVLDRRATRQARLRERLGSLR